MSATRYPWQVNAAAIVISAAALFALLDILSLHSSANQFPPDPFGVAGQIDRLEPLRRLVPPDQMIEYSQPSTPESFDSLLFFATQYAAAPRLLMDPGKAPGSQWAVGSVSLGQSRNWKPASDLGAGLVLFDKGAPKK